MASNFSGKSHTQKTKEKIRSTKLSGLKWYPKKYIGSPTYSVWANMKTRCTNENTKSYKAYGAKGITVCEKWINFSGFLEDMGERPPETSIDRIDNNKGYSKDNCRWATIGEQARNRRRTKFITWNGKTLCLTDWAAEIGVKKSTMMQRYFAYKWPIEKCLTFTK